MGYPTNQQCWDLAHSLGVDPIQVFAYAASHAMLPPDPASLLANNQAVWTWAGNVGIDPVYGFGFEQIHGGLPGTLPALQGYLNILGVRDSTTGLLSHEQPGSPGGMIRPGPGDGYVGNVQPTDPGIAVRPYSVAGTAMPGQTGVAAASSAGTYIPSGASAPATTARTPATPAPGAASGNSGGAPPASGGTLSGYAPGSGGIDGSTSTTTTSGAAPSGQLSGAMAWLKANPLEALAIAGGAYLLLFGVPSHKGR